MKGKNGHELETSRTSYYGGSSTHVWCTNEGCFLDAKAEYSIREIVDEKMQESCPIEPNVCISCEEPIVDEADYCQYCRLKPGRRIYDRDDEGMMRKEMKFIG